MRTIPTRTLEVLRDEIAGCSKCALLSKSRTKTVFSRGNPDASLIVVGEAPGRNEDREGLPFIGMSGKLLDELLRDAEVDPVKDIYVLNAVKCWPAENRKPTTDELDACRPYLQEHLSLLKPKVIVSLGVSAFEALTRQKVLITQTRGKWHLYDGRIPLMPSFHPAVVFRAPNRRGLLFQDLYDAADRWRELTGME